MKKEVICVLFMGLLLIGALGIVDAKKSENSGGSTSGSNSDGSSDSTGDDIDSDDESDDESGSDDSTEEVEDNNGKNKEESKITLIDSNSNEYQVEVRVETKNNGEDSEVKIKVRNVEINSEVEVEQEGNQLNAKLSNGNKAEIKIMPDTASATAIEKLQSRGVNVELKEVGEGNDLSVVYEAEANKSVKFLGLFKVQTQIKAVISAENGEVLRLEKPWWYFLAFGKGSVDCDSSNLDLCDDSLECEESGLVWFEESCVALCPEDEFVCEDNLTILSRDFELQCEFDLSECPVVLLNQTA